MRIVIALGGNALLRRSDPMTTAVQRRNIRTAAEAIAPLAAEHSIVVVHGNGPQVGLLALQSSAYSGAEPYPLDVLDAGTQGMIGYLIQQELRSLLPPENQVATLLTMIVVDPADPAFSQPAKFIGPVYAKDDADALAAEKGWVLAVVFKLDAIASIGSAVALLIFTFVTAAHFRVRAETGASVVVLTVAITASAAVLLNFFTTLIHEPASMVTLLAIVLLSVGLDFAWKRTRDSRVSQAHVSG